MRAKFALLALVNGKRITIPIRKNTVMPPGASRFYVRYRDETGKRHDQPLGTVFTEAVKEVQNLEAGRIFERATGTKLPSHAPLSNGVSLHSSIESYLEEIRANRARETWRGYRDALRWLEKFLPNRHLNSITRSDLLKFKNYLADEKYSPCTVFNAFLRVKIFLKKAGVPIHLEADDWPHFVPRDPDWYTPEQLTAMIQVATPDETLLIKSFLYSGMRRDELKNLTYGDIDFRRSIWTVRAKNGWKPKKRASTRSILILPSLTKEIEERMARNAAIGTDYVFPNRYGTANGSLLCTLKKVAARAGIKGRVDLHKLRSTYATMRLRSGVDIREVATRLGHGNLGTIMRYVAAMKLESPEAMEQTTKTFGGFDTIRS